MYRKNPIFKAKYIESKFKEYLLSTYLLDNDIYNEQLINELKNTILMKGPYLSKSLDFQKRKTLNELIEEGYVHRDFRLLNKVYLDRKLYAHQEKAIKRVVDGHSLIITTGTGSGKTESFLYPIINELLKEPTINEPGIRAIFLFPLNALVNDQFKRVQEILENYRGLNFGFYTGNTSETTIEQLKKEMPNRFLSREQIRNNPPHILFTNYSMLEYILLRPKDNTLLSSTNTKHWKFIVLDEAHTYRGAQGIEMGMLLRRLQNKIGHQVQFILTSATLGTEDDEGIKKIRDFGYKLTSQKFEKEDVIFSERIKLNKDNIEYTIKPTDYVEIYKNMTISNIRLFLDKYDLKNNSVDIDEMLYDLLIKDSNLYLLDFLLSESMLVEELFEELKNFGFTSIEEVCALVDIVCKCKKKGDKILDLKYHTFIRSLSGAYITLGDNPKLALKKYSEIDNKKTFEIGVCKSCNTMYIFGQIIDGKLEHSSFVNIYDNYDENDNLNISFFLLKKDLEKSEYDQDDIEEYLICPICGKLVSKKESNKMFCEHNTVDKVEVCLIKNTKNNVTHCLACNSMNKEGLVSTINMGKESSTALLTQIFFEVLPSEEVEAKKQNQISLKEKKVPKEKSSNCIAKQILAFSDARQQASFTVKFAEKNHHRFLRKRLINQILLDNNNQPLNFQEAETRLDAIITKGDLFDTQNEINGTIQARITLLEELLKIDGINGGEGLGMYYFQYDEMVDAIKELSEQEYKEFKQLNHITFDITQEQLIVAFNTIFDKFRRVPAVEYYDISSKIKEDYFLYRMFDNQVALLKPTEAKGSKDKDITKSIYGLVSKGHRINNIEEYFMNSFSIDKDTADSLIETIWEYIVDVLSVSDRVYKTYKIRANSFTLHSYMDTKWYYCNKCRKLTRYNINEVCPHCMATSLIEVDPNEIYKSNYYRKEYYNKKIEKLVYKEHTAQLSAERAKERQEEFIKKNINYLSCTTTFEMGIDIGSLENVFLRNVPPLPSNYVQRAGRAGRSDEASAFILTYCSASSHDYTYFEEPLKMVDGKCETPRFEMKNTKIILRHLLAMALAKFYSMNSEEFASIKTFFIDGGLKKFEEYLKSKPQDLIVESNNVLSTTSAEFLKDGEWIDKILSKDEINIYASSDNYLEMYNEFLLKKEEAYRVNNENLTKYYMRQIKQIEGEANIIKALADGNLIPKHGFPTDLVEMKIQGIDLRQEKYDLTRDMKIALSEYAPDSEIMVDKNLIVSRYINKPDNLTRYYYKECPKCRKIGIKYFPEELEKCPYCDNDNSNKDYNVYITPVYGFYGEEISKKSKVLKPKKSLTSPIKYIGNGVLEDDIIKINDVIEISTIKNDELMIMNENPFYMCPKCGITKIDKSDPNRKKIYYGKKLQHNDKFGNECDSMLEKIALGYKYKTDVLKIGITTNGVDFTAHAQSALYALLDGISNAFNIERQDIDGLLLQEDNKIVFALFDSVPGGAGHVKRLINKEEMVNSFKCAYDKVNQNCCDSACYLCIKNYQNQRIHHLLSRILAKQFIEYILNSLQS